MSVCTFYVEVQGERDALHKLKAFLDKGVENNASTPERVLSIRQLYGDFQSVEHEFVLLSDDHPGPKYDQFTVCDGPFWFTAGQDRMVIGGEAKWGPPVPLVKRLSGAFPELDFTIVGTTEHEDHEESYSRKLCSS